jgi:hypothetical protein
MARPANLWPVDVKLTAANNPSSATWRTGRSDGNRGAAGGFAAAQS